jgi:hypothetical protein
MATNVYRKYAGFRNEEWEVPAGTRAGQVVINGTDGRVGLALTSRGDVTAAYTLPNGLTISNNPVGGTGNKPDCATVGVEGYDALLTVTGVTAGETVGTGQTGTAQGTPVYGVVSGGAITSYTTSASGNTKIGVIADGNIVGGVAPVSIGVDL